MDKDISIIVPVYNTEKYLRRCLDSIINQKYDNINCEIIIVNDASTDNSIEIIYEYLQKDNRIVLIDKRENQGLSEARNSGIEIAQGEYILHIDSDDWIEENYIYDVVSIAKQEQADIVVTDYILDNDNKNYKYIQDQDNKFLLNSNECIEKICLMKAHPNIWNKLIKKNLYFNNHIRHPKGINLGEDLAVLIQLFHYANKIVKLNKAYIHYICNPNSITRSKYNEKKFDDLMKVLEINQKFLLNTNIEKKYIELLKLNHYFTCLTLVKFKSSLFYEKKIDELLKMVKKSNVKDLRLALKPLYYINKRISFSFLKCLVFIRDKIYITL